VFELKSNLTVRLSKSSWVIDWLVFYWKLRNRGEAALRPEIVTWCLRERAILIYITFVIAFGANFDAVVPPQHILLKIYSNVTFRERFLKNIILTGPPRFPPQRVAARCRRTAKIELCPRFSSCIFDCRFRVLTAQSSWVRVLWGWPIVSCRKPIDWVNWCTENRSLLWFNCRERIRRIEALLRFVESRFRCSIVLDSGRVDVQSARYWMNWAQKTYLCCVIEDRPTIDPWIDQSYWIGLVHWLIWKRF